MKKIFTLIAVAAMALSANAQGKYALEAGSGAITAGTTITSVTNCSLTFGVSGEADFKDPKANGSIDGYTAFTEGNGVNGSATGGTQYILKPSFSGSIEVAVVLNADKAFFVLEDDEALTDYNGIKKDAKYYGTFKFDVKAGKTYKVYCTGSKLGFYGFDYTVDPTGINTVKAADMENAPAYNLAGQKVNDSYKGVVVKAGKKIVNK